MVKDLGTHLAGTTRCGQRRLAAVALYPEFTRFTPHLFLFFVVFLATLFLISSFVWEALCVSVRAKFYFFWPVE